MPVGLTSPPTLAPGARVALVAPAGPLRDERDLERAIANVRELGWEPIVGTHAMARSGYLAGLDHERLSDLQRALDDRDIDAVWCLRGGYGAMRLLEALDFTSLRSHPKALIGFSDITALHAAAGRAVHIVTFHGPTARGVLTPFSRTSLSVAVAKHGDSCGFAADGRTLHSGRAQGRLVGGNLALLAALAGTPYEPDYDGAILAIEDVNEPLYRVDRMLTQLRLSGALAGVVALASGAFTESPEAEASSAFDELFQRLAASLHIPCVAGIPMGHINDQWTLPLGALATLDADARRLTIER